MDQLYGLFPTSTQNVLTKFISSNAIDKIHGL